MVVYDLIAYIFLINVKLEFNTSSKIYKYQLRIRRKGNRTLMGFFFFQEEQDEKFHHPFQCCETLFNIEKHLPSMKN